MIVFGEAHLRPDPWQVCRLMKRGLIDRWTRMHRFIGRSSTTASLHHDLFSTACITNIADSDFLHAPEVDSVRSRGRRRGRPPTVKRQRAGTNLPRLVWGVFCQGCLSILYSCDLGVYKPAPISHREPGGDGLADERKRTTKLSRGELAIRREHRATNLYSVDR